MVNFRVIGAILGMLLPIVTQAEPAWVEDHTVQEQLAAGQVAVRIQFEDQSRIRVNAAVKVNASAETIWGVLTDCEHASSFIPGVKRCRLVQSAPDTSWEIIEHEAKYSWFMPAVTSVIRADYKRPERIDFKRLSGDLKQEQGDWVLQPAAAESSEQDSDPQTIVEYELYVDPGFWIPRVLLRHSLRSELPAALRALRERAEGTVAKQ
jgi:ribosome-associated toxin RatA of RatAB toxin-antitoxin module